MAQTSTILSPSVGLALLCRHYNVTDAIRTRQVKNRIVPNLTKRFKPEIYALVIIFRFGRSEGLTLMLGGSFCCFSGLALKSFECEVQETGDRHLIAFPSRDRVSTHLLFLFSLPRS